MGRLSEDREAGPFFSEEYIETKMSGRLREIGYSSIGRKRFREVMDSLVSRGQVEKVRVYRYECSLILRPLGRL